MIYISIVANKKEETMPGVHKQTMSEKTRQAYARDFLQAQATYRIHTFVSVCLELCKSRACVATNKEQVDNNNNNNGRPATHRHWWIHRRQVELLEIIRDQIKRLSLQAIYCIFFVAIALCFYFYSGSGVE